MHAGSPSQRRGKVLHALAALLAATATGACDRAREASPSPPDDDPAPRAVALPAAPGWVGSARCVECHAEAAASWQGSDHDHSLDLPTEDTVLGAFDGRTATHGRVRTTFSRDEGRYVVRTDGADGALHDFPVAYVVGVRPLQQYVTATEGGRLQSLPWLWDTRPEADGGQRWYHLYGDEAIDSDDALHWTGPAQNYNYVCADCHGTAVRRGYDPEADRFETRWEAMDVSCEACHGPGEAHVAWAADQVGYPNHGLTVTLAPSEPWVMDPRTGSARPHPRDDAQLTTCAPCHSRRAPIVDGPRPGAPFLDAFLPELLRPGLYHADGQILDEVYVWGSFVQSRMFHAGVRCSDCHDPHALTLRAPGNALCAGCHDPARFDAPAHHHHATGSAGAECVGCHMPSRVYMGVDVRRDHSIRVPRPDLTARFGTPNACGDCHEERGVTAEVPTEDGWPAPPTRVEPAEALALGRAGGAGAFDALAALASDGEAPAIARATALEYLAAFPRQRLVAIVRDAARSEEPLVRLGATLGSMGLPPDVRALLLAPIADDPVRAVRMGVARAVAGADMSRLPVRDREAIGRAFDTFLAANAVSASRPEAWVERGVFEVERGRAAEAEAAYRHALRLDADYEAARLNLADLYRAMGNEGAAEAEIRAVLRDAPEHPEALHALGLLMVRQSRLDAALPLLDRARRLRPGSARFLYVYAIALDSAGRTADAIALLREGFARFPGDADIGVALASYLRRDEKVDEAREVVTAVLGAHPEHPGALELAAALP